MGSWVRAPAGSRAASDRCFFCILLHSFQCSLPRRHDLMRLPTTKIQHFSDICKYFTEKIVQVPRERQPSLGLSSFRPAIALHLPCFYHASAYSERDSWNWSGLKTDRQCIENGSIEQHDLEWDWSDLPPISAKQQPRNNYLRALTSARGE